MSEKATTSKPIWIPQAIVIAALSLLAFRSGNFDQYTLVLRGICCVCFAYLAFQAYQKGKVRWTWRLGIVAVVYNPLFNATPDRDIWLIVYAITIVIAIGSIVAFKPPKTDR
ncbi:MAG: hypothetical protein QF408_12865 [Pirellulales bacterium]|nr:hypothetical protein [Pirellulales bacterium]